PGQGRMSRTWFTPVGIVVIVVITRQTGGTPPALGERVRSRPPPWTRRRGVGLHETRTLAGIRTSGRTPVTAARQFRICTGFPFFLRRRRGLSNDRKTDLTTI